MELSKEKEKEAWTNFAAFVAQHHISLNSVSSRFFARFVKILNPRARVLSRPSLRKEISCLYSSLRESLKGALSKAESLALTTDTCTINGVAPITSLIGHFLDTLLRPGKFIEGQTQGETVQQREYLRGGKE